MVEKVLDEMDMLAWPELAEHVPSAKAPATLQVCLPTSNVYVTCNRGHHDEYGAPACRHTLARQPPMMTKRPFGGASSPRHCHRAGMITSPLCSPDTWHCH